MWPFQGAVSRSLKVARLLSFFCVGMGVIAIEHFNVSNLEAHSTFRLSLRTCCAMGNSQRQAKTSMQAHKEPHLELFMRFSHCLSICLLSPVVGIFPKKAYSSSIKQEKRTPCDSLRLSGPCLITNKIILGRAVPECTRCPTWWQVWGISGNGEVVLRVV